MSVAIVAMIVLLNFSSCDKYNYTDQLQGLGDRVEKLEDSVLVINNGLKDLQKLITNVESHGFITNVIHNADGTWTLTLYRNGKEETITIRDGKYGQDGLDGHDGKEIDFSISASQDADGVWYWTINGEWLLDENGNKMRASAIDGKDGADGKDGVNGQDGQNNPLSPAIVPQVRINEVTRNWEISTDGGSTWNDIGVYADGKDGKDGQDGKDGKDGKDGQDGKDGLDGKNGKNGTDDIFVDVIESADGTFITFVLNDGKTFTIPIVKE